MTQIHWLLIPPPVNNQRNFNHTFRDTVFLVGSNEGFIYFSATNKSDIKMFEDFLREFALL